MQCKYDGISRDKYIYWPKMKVRDKLWNRTKGWFEQLHLNTCSNNNDTMTTTYQHDGGANLTLNKLA